MNAGVVALLSYCKIGVRNAHLRGIPLASMAINMEGSRGTKCASPTARYLYLPAFCLLLGSRKKWYLEKTLKELPGAPKAVSCISLQP